jgi:hypothetical protein
LARGCETSQEESELKLGPALPTTHKSSTFDCMTNEWIIHTYLHGIAEG